MTTVVHIHLYQIAEDLTPGNVIPCTINDKQHKAEFVRYGASERFVWVRIYGIRETSDGFSFSPQLDMFSDAEPLELVTKFIVNHALGKPWHRTAGLSGNAE